MVKVGRLLRLASVIIGVRIREKKEREREHVHGRDRKVVGEKTNKRIKLFLIIMFDYSWSRDYFKRWYLPKHGVKKVNY